MTRERFSELLNKRLNRPIDWLFMLRLTEALRSVVERCGEAGDAALEAHCREVEVMDRIKNGEPLSDETVGQRIYESMRRGGSKPV